MDTITYIIEFPENRAEDVFKWSMYIADQSKLDLHTYGIRMLPINKGTNIQVIRSPEKIVLGTIAPQDNIHRIEEIITKDIG